MCACVFTQALQATLYSFVFFFSLYIFLFSFFFPFCLLFFKSVSLFIFLPSIDSDVPTSQSLSAYLL